MEGIISQNKSRIKKYFNIIIYYFENNGRQALYFSRKCLSMYWHRISCIRPGGGGMK